MSQRRGIVDRVEPGRFGAVAGALQGQCGAVK